MDEITLDDKTYVSSKRAAEITGYAKDYVGQLCREGRVEARLVGRNWYVLEESIREHRFGAAPAPEVKNPLTEAPVAVIEPDPVTSAPDPVVESIQDAWKSPNYTTDLSPVLIPTIQPVEKKSEINKIDSFIENKGSYGVFTPKPEEEQANRGAIKEMQSAWHDWFVRTNELSVSEETLLESPKSRIANDSENSSEEIEEIVPLHRIKTTEEAEPITLNKVSEAIERRSEAPEDSFGEEEQVVLHRAPEAPIARTNASSVYSHGNLGRNAYAPVKDEYEGRIIRERRVIRKTVKTKQGSSVLVKTFLILIAIFAIAITAIDSGELDGLLSRVHATNPAIQYLVGESTVTNTK